MKCLVITGTQQKGCTYHLKEIFLEELKADQVVEFTLPKDGPAYCLGCKRCFLESEDLCPHADKVGPIWQAILAADLIVFAYPVYVLRAPGHVKSLLDHLGVHWLVHRPDPRMFSKRVAIITQSIGGPNKEAQKDVETSLRWMGVPEVRRIGFGLREGVVWEELSPKRRQTFAKKLRAFARYYHDSDPVKPTLRVRFGFGMGKRMQKQVIKKTPEGKALSVDAQYWLDHGWIKKR